MHPGQRLGPGARWCLTGGTALHGEILERRFHGRRLVRLWTEDGSPVDAAVDAIGHVPLPPVHQAGRSSARSRALPDRVRPGARLGGRAHGRAAPSATSLPALAARGVEIVEITLHVGYGTFQPVRVDQVEEHRLDAERYEIGAAPAAAMNRALDESAASSPSARRRRGRSRRRRAQRRAARRRARRDGPVHLPGVRFRVIGGLLTNFHVPQSSLLMLVSAFAGREHVLRAYRAAVAERYRFYSYGDAMLIL